MTQYSLSDFDIVPKALGSGSFGSVFLAQRKSDGETVALKFIKVGKGSSDKQTMKEAETLSKIEHPNIIRYLGSFTTEMDSSTVLCIIMEYAEFGSLRDIIRV